MPSPSRSGPACPTRARPALAADGFTASLLPELAPTVVPTRGQVIATEPLPELVYDRPHYARGGYDYWHQLRDRRGVQVGPER